MRIPKQLVLICLVALALTPACMAQTQLAGDWQGTLVAGEQSFRVAWHVTKASDGSLISTFDNIDQGVFGIKIKSTSLKGSDITMSVDTVIQSDGKDVPVKGILSGKVKADGSEVNGTWSQTDPEQPPAAVTLKRAEATPPAATSPQPK